MNGELPEGWTSRELGSIIHPSKRKADPGESKGRPYVGLEHLEGGTNRIVGHGDSASVKSTMAVFAQGDVLFSKLRPYLNKVAVAPFDGVGSTEILVFEKRCHLESKYLTWLLSQQGLVRIANDRAAGVQLPRITFEKIADIEVPVAPLPEQRRIVIQVEALLEQVGRAKDRLDRVLHILKRFRQAVLAAACSGELTRLWRDTYAPTAGIGEKSAVDDDNVLPEIPDAWACTALGNVVEDSFYGPRFSADQYASVGVPTVRTTDMDFRGNISVAESPKVHLSPAELARYRLQDGDLLVTRTGATIGKCAIYRSTLGPALPSAYLIRFRLRRELVDPRYVLLFLQSPFGQRLLGIGQTSVAQPNVNARAIAGFPFPLPSAPEQAEILTHVDRLLTIADTIESRLQAATVRAGKLPQAILSKAFSGELVPTEAYLARAEGRTYETAEALLAKLHHKQTQEARPDASPPRAATKRGREGPARSKRS